MKNTNITDCYVDKINVRDIPANTFCTLWYSGDTTRFHLLFGQDISDIYSPDITEEENRGQLIAYNGEEITHHPDFMTYLNYLTFNGFELISYHPSNKGAFFIDSYALLKKK